MDDSPRQDGAGAALIAFAVVVLLVISVASFYWLTSLRAQRALVESQRAVEAEAAARQAEARAMELAARASAIADPQTAGPEFPGGDEDAEATIRGLLQAQLASWNAGDIDAFMEHYWKSEGLTFSSGGKLTRGWQETLENYRQRYPSRDDMGTTSFENLEVTLLSPASALVLGDWRLERDSGDIGGKFSLVFRRIDGRWVIVHDHTSRTEQP